MRSECDSVRRVSDLSQFGVALAWRDAGWMSRRTPGATTRANLHVRHHGQLLLLGAVVGAPH